MKIRSISPLRYILTASLLLAISIVAITPKALALSGSEFRAGRIIDDAVFFNPGSMSVNEIQQFLNSKVPTCDTNGTQARGDTTRAAYGTSAGYPPPYTCIKSYSENVGSRSADSYCSGGVSGGTKSAAQIIYDVSMACGISPKALIVTLQKEQSLITDDWPWSIQYRSAMGYGCPDTAACDSQYYGFFNQVYSAARQFQRYAKQPGVFNFYGGQTSYVQYNPNSGCGGGNVYMESQATAGLYNFTPYQPNGAALNNLYGTGDGCSAYGNRNFWRLFNDWFGSTQTNIAYQWQFVSAGTYVDSNRTQPFNRGAASASIAPGGKAYIRVKARNMGNQRWTKSVVKVGTSKPNDRCSTFTDSSWLNCARIAMVENEVTPGGIATFDFSVTAPQTTGSYKEYFNLLAEGITWLNDPGMYFDFDVVQPASPGTTENTLTSNSNLLPGRFLLSNDRHSSLIMQGDGNTVLHVDGKPVWSTGTPGYRVSKLIMQSDGNLVLYGADMQPNWSSGTSGNPGAYVVLQTDGNLVVYSSGGSPLWSSGTAGNPNGLNYVATTFGTGTLVQTQVLSTAKGDYKLYFQTDGNLVLYSPNRALWSSGTAGRSANRLYMQGDGNLVIYDTNNRAVWSSNSAGRGSSTLAAQTDGNLVIYGQNGRPSWSSGTAGQN